MSSVAALRSRLLAVVLLLASPGAGGMVLSALHPCPVDQPWAAAAGAAQAQEHAHHHGGEGSRPEHRHCHCIGSCEDVASPGPGSALTDVAFVLPVVRAIAPESLGTTPVPAPRNLHPPSTAPPQA